MEDEEKEGISMCEMQSWFEEKGITLNTDWLSSLLSHMGSKATIKSVFEQFVFSRLEESYERPMKIPENASKIILTRRIVFQVLSVVNIARPIYDQMRDELHTEDNLTWFYGDESEAHEGQTHENEGMNGKGRQCSMITVTDGSTTLKGIDYGRVDGLTDAIPIGTKLIIIGKVTCRRSVMVLKADNCKILGGAFELEEQELSKAERLSLLLPTSKSKIEPYLSRVKKELELNQRRISPFLRRISREVAEVPPPHSFPPINPPKQLTTSVPPVSNAVVDRVRTVSPHVPPAVPLLRGEEVGGALVQSSLPPAAIVEPTVKIEEMEDSNILCIHDEAPRFNNNRLVDSLDSMAAAEPRGAVRLPIIPPAGHIEMMQSSQMDPLDDHRLHLPVRPCVKLTPQTLEERIHANQTRGRNRELPLIEKKGAAAITSGSKDSSRSIASYFQATKIGETRWNKRTQMVEPSSKVQSGCKIEADRREMEEGIEEGKRKEREARKMREEMERRDKEQRMRNNEEERQRRIYYENMRRNDDERRWREEENERQRNSYGLYGVSNAPQVSVVVVSTPTPSSYITPPAVVTLPQSNQINHLRPLSHHQAHIPPVVRQSCSFRNDFLLGGDDRPSVPMNLFGSPPRVDRSTVHTVIPFKKTKIEDQKMISESLELDGFQVNNFNTFHKQPTSYDMLQPMHHMNGMHHEMSANGMRNGYETGLQQLNQPTMCEPPSSILYPPMDERSRHQLSSHEEDVKARYMSLNIISLMDVLGKRKFWMMPKSFHIAPMYALIDRNLNIEQGLWDMKMKIVDDSGETLMCQLDPRLLEELLGFSVVSARRLRESNVTQFHKFKDRGSKMFKSMERMDLILDVEVTPEPKELPIITKIRTLSEVLGIL
ncbi:hypothetical protein PFISCL1PPCAC_20044 [Pristionchus fissidentatus]|uniref:RecQ-mediated genome instability protein 1 n=1 Tax=Pristionchus fissidentatus TaxID=1538716 RepID=A0AAV5WA92_9BILA|nr:hypothetical protein PFISCL1PPCAC_20044 [Pristionchus fissidentatus]